MFVLLSLIILFILFSQLVGHTVTFYFQDALTNIKYKWPVGFFCYFRFDPTCLFSDAVCPLFYENCQYCLYDYFT